MKKKLPVFGILLLFVITALLISTNVMANLWGIGTGQGYLIPEESSMISFKATQMNTGSGEYWLYGEDEHYYYSMMATSGLKPYVFISKEKAVSCDHFDKFDFKTWCQ
ncbi:hypothetical protein [Pedobacter steynii]|uniref:Uncharacterized protein n=1 Tax=Pedobacter steynii TaxID=430522 RepID=A0A1D7QJ48_9SPHI|nr:hypothetical protein [Pedobacter steynii]AOM78695.1 hypothetical protein BFS30_16850 [Pedobacter steynii]